MPKHKYYHYHIRSQSDIYLCTQESNFYSTI